MTRLTENDIDQIDTAILTAADRFKGEARLRFLKTERDVYRRSAAWHASGGRRDKAEAYRVFACRVANEHRESLDLLVRPGAA